MSRTDQQQADDDAVLRYRMNSMEAQLDKIIGKVDELQKDIQAVRDAMLRIGHCPKPGLCLDLENACKRHEGDIRKIENAIAWAKGAAWAAGILGGVVGAILSKLGAMLLPVVS